MMRRLPIFLLIAILAACSLPEGAPPARPVPPSSTPEASTAAPEAKARERLRADLAAGDFPAALSRIAREIRVGRPEQVFAEEFPQAANGILAAAESHSAAGRYEEAGRLLGQAMETYPRDPELAAKVTKSLPAIQEMRRTAADRLMEQGLLAYRAGQLEEAIATWKRLLAFYPDHRAARQAVETASLQLQNLKSIK